MKSETGHILFNQSFGDFCAFKEAVSTWETDFMLTSWNGFKSTLFQSLVNDCFFSQVTLSCNLDQKGLSPVGMRTFVIPCHDQVEYIWRRHQVKGNVIQLFPKNGELASVSNVSFDAYIVSFSNKLVEEVALQLGMDPSPQYLDKERTWEVPPRCLHYMRNVCLQYKCGVSDRENMLLKALLVSLFCNEAQPPYTVKNKDAAIRKIEDLIYDKKSEIIYMKELVELTGMSERSLQYIFKHRYGVTPMAFIKSKKLHWTYMELAKGSVSSVADIANRNGFWHMGQFAADFRRKFGFLPSEQLNNTKGKV